MRDDMAKVVTERPRRGHGNANKKTTGRRIRRLDPDMMYDDPPVSPSRAADRTAMKPRSFGPRQPAEAIPALLHRKTVGQGAQRVVAEAE